MLAHVGIRIRIQGREEGGSGEGREWGHLMWFSWDE